MNKIKVGVLVDDIALPAWVNHMLGQIATEEGMELALVVKYAYKRRPEKKIAAQAAPWLLSLWMALDKRLVKVGHDAFRTEPLVSTLPGIPTLNVEVESRECGDHLDARDLANIAAYGITVFLRLGSLRPCGEIFDTASCGIWSYRHGDEVIERDGPRRRVGHSSRPHNDGVRLADSDPRGRAPAHAAKIMVDDIPCVDSQESQPLLLEDAFVRAEKVARA